MGRMLSGMKTLFVIELIYKSRLAGIDASMKAHVRFLKKYYAAGTADTLSHSPIQGELYDA